jgi:hypothetical protein
MAHNVYAVFDRNDGKVYQFAALETVLAKDAVLAFMEENASALFGTDTDTKELAMRQVSETDSIESLTSVLIDWEMDFNLIQIV